MEEIVHIDMYDFPVKHSTVKLANFPYAPLKKKERRHPCGATPLFQLSHKMSLIPNKKPIYKFQPSW